MWNIEAADYGGALLDRAVVSLPASTTGKIFLDVLA